MKNRMTTPSHRSIPSVVPPANCFHVLVIDDMPANRILLGKFLKSAGYAVSEATNGIEALNLLRDRAVTPDLIITDVEMPVMDGITLIEQVRYLNSSLAQTPIITASGNADEPMRNQALRAGTDVFLTKPFDLKALQKAISSLLKSRRKTGRPVSPLRAPGRVEHDSAIHLEK
ncbi:MAG: response regulator [Verrucomicrobiota bacterium]